MKTLACISTLICFFTLTSFSQDLQSSFDVHQVLYYENENCSNDNFQNKYAIVYQNLQEPGKFITYSLKSFQDPSITLYLVNQHKVIANPSFPHANFNAASGVEIDVKGIKSLNDVQNFPDSKVELKYIKKENVRKGHRMLIAYHFKAKNFDNIKEIIYYIDHSDSGYPLSFHKSFYEEMRKSNNPLIGNVVQRDEILKNGETCSFVLQRVKESRKKFAVNFVE